MLRCSRAFAVSTRCVKQCESSCSIPGMCQLCSELRMVCYQEPEKIQALFQSTVWELKEENMKEEKCAQLRCDILCCCKPHGEHCTVGICVAAVTSAGGIALAGKSPSQGRRLESRSWGQPVHGRDVVRDVPVPSVPSSLQ